MLQHRALAGLPFALHVLDDADLHAVAERAHHQSERRRGLPLALPGVDDEKTLLDGLGGQDPVARGLALSGLLVRPAVDLLFGAFFGHDPLRSDGGAAGRIAGRRADACLSALMRAS